MPPGNQRPDKKCGNIGWGDLNIKGLRWFRALCDPDGDNPCCYNNKCVNKTMEECRCTNCLDMRRPVQAEYATWQPVHPSCKPKNWTVAEVCRLLANSTLFFLGDSFVRHVYTALLLTVTGNDVTGAHRKNIAEGKSSFRSFCFVFQFIPVRLALSKAGCKVRKALRHFAHST